MTKRVCYIHVGPHKTGTTSIQWCLQENRAELLKRGYFLLESETKRGLTTRSPRSWPDPGEILLDLSLAVEAPWNNVANRSGLISRQ